MKRILPCLLALLVLLPSFGAMAQTDSRLEWNATTFAKLFPYAKQVQERAKDAVVLRTDVNCALVRGEQTVVDEQIKVTPEEQNGTVFVPAAFTAASLGAEVSVQAADTVAFRADGKDVTITAGTASMQVAGAEQRLSAVPYAKEGLLLAPVTELAALFGKKVTVTTERETGGLIIISDTEPFFQEGEEDLAWELICQMSYARPSGKQVLADMEAHQNGAHPRIMATAADFARIRRDVKTDPLMKQWFEDTKATADELIAKDLGEPPLVTPSSQIVGTQAVFNVLMGERYKVATKETKDILRGKYGATVKPFNEEVKKKVLGDDPDTITCRPADLIPDELDTLRKECEQWIQQHEDVLTYALFPQVAVDFFKYREAQQTKIDPDKADKETGSYPV